jgi:hypothetical protein
VLKGSINITPLKLLKSASEPKISLNFWKTNSATQITNKTARHLKQLTTLSLQNGTFLKLVSREKYS